LGFCTSLPLHAKVARANLLMQATCHRQYHFWCQRQSESTNIQNMRGAGKARLFRAINTCHAPYPSTCRKSMLSHAPSFATSHCCSSSSSSSSSRHKINTHLSLSRKTKLQCMKPLLLCNCNLRSPGSKTADNKQQVKGADQIAEKPAMAVSATAAAENSQQSTPINPFV